MVHDEGCVIGVKHRRSVVRVRVDRDVAEHLLADGLSIRIESGAEGPEGRYRDLDFWGEGTEGRVCIQSTYTSKRTGKTRLHPGLRSRGSKRSCSLSSYIVNFAPGFSGTRQKNIYKNKNPLDSRRKNFRIQSFHLIGGVLKTPYALPDWFFGANGTEPKEKKKEAPVAKTTTPNLPVPVIATKEGLGGKLNQALMGAYKKGFEDGLKSGRAEAERELTEALNNLGVV